MSDYNDATPADMAADEIAKDESKSYIGPVWDTKTLQRDFEVIGFAPPYVVVIRKSDNKRGTVEFRHHPRIYFSWQPE